MSRYIDADAIKYHEDDAVYRHEIDLIPTADVRKNVHGEWKMRTYKDTPFVDSVCSNCGKAYSLYPLSYNYCPNCDADMRGETIEQ